MILILMVMVTTHLVDDHCDADFDGTFGFNGLVVFFFPVEVELFYCFHFYWCFRRILRRRTGASWAAR